jgi:hypothetical protein
LKENPMRRFLVAALALIVPVLPAAAQKDMRQERIEFSEGQKTSKVIRGAIRSDEIVNYVIDIPADRKLAISMQTSGPSSYFDILAPGDAAMHLGSKSGNSFVGSTLLSGDYVIRVYQTNNPARRNERARYALNIQIAGPSPAIQAAGSPASAPKHAPDFADALAGGPTWWRVVVTEGGALNMRAAPSAQSEVVARLPHGAELKNGGCQMTGKTRWCRVTTKDGQEGWAAGRYLRE